jgi:hypothetical protein
MSFFQRNQFSLRDIHRHKNIVFSRLVEKQISRIVTFSIVLILAAAAYNIGSPTLQAASKQSDHAVGVQFELAPAKGPTTISIKVTPPVRDLPIVSLIGGPQHETKKLSVRSERSGIYTAVIGDVSQLVDGQILVELQGVQPGLHELHTADFSVREVPGRNPSSSPSHDGHFVVFTKPSEVPQSQLLLIGSSEQPIDALPPGIANRNVVAVYSFAFLSQQRLDLSSWRLTMTIPPNDGEQKIFYLARPGEKWKELQSSLIVGHPLLTAAVAGPGTYLFVRGAKR